MLRSRCAKTPRVTEHFAVGESPSSAPDAGGAALERGDEFGRRPLKISMFFDVAAEILDGALDAGR
jgi:hypothetical protein